MPALVALILLAQSKWTSHEVGGFSLDLPAAPQPLTVPNSPKGSLFWFSPHGERNVVLFGTAPVLDKERAVLGDDGIMAAALAGTLRPIKGTLLSQRDVLVDGWPALDARFRDTEGFGAVRIVVVGDTVAQIVVTGPSAASVEPPFTRVVSSLGVPRRAKGPLEIAGPSFSPRVLGDSRAVVDLPREPQVESGPINTTAESAVIHRFTAAWGNRIYVAAYTDVPARRAAEAAKHLDDLNADVASSLRGKADVPRDATLDGRVAREITVSRGELGVAIVRSALIDGRLYTLLAIVPVPWRDHNEVKHFFGSFHSAASSA